MDNKRLFFTYVVRIGTIIWLCTQCVFYTTFATEQTRHAIIQNELWIQYVPLHVSAISTCQEHISDPDLVVVWLEPLLQDVIIDFRSQQKAYRCHIGAYGGEPTILDSTTDQSLPHVIFTLLPAYPNYPCFHHKIIENHVMDPPEAVGWISTKYCTTP